MSRRLPPLAPAPPAAPHHAPGGRRVLGEVIGLAYPVVLGNLAHTMMGVTDVLFMGWVSTAAQGAVGLGAILTWTVTAFFVGTLTVITTFTAQHLGAGQPHRCGSIVWHGLLLAAAGGLLAELLAPWTSSLVHYFGAPEEVSAITRRYAFIRLAGMPLVLADTCFTSFLRGIGDTRTPMKVAFGMVCLNVPLNLWLIFGGLGLPPLGPDGAAYATVIANGAAALALLAIFLHRTTRARFATAPPRRLDPPLLASLLRVGVPIGVSWALEMITWMVFSAAVSRLGPQALAAHNIVLQVIHLSFMPGMGLQVAATTLVGQHLGAGDPDGAERTGRATLRLGMGYMALMGVVFLTLGRRITRAFNTEPVVVVLGGKLFALAAAFQIFDAMALVSGGILRGAGDTRFPMMATIGFTWLVFLPCIWFFGFHLGWGAVGCWGGATTYITGLGLVMLLRVRSGRWKTFSVVDDGRVPSKPAATT